jgi:hypothetical protein
MNRPQNVASDDRPGEGPEREPEVDPTGLELDSDSRLEAVYRLEAWIRCANCRESIDTIGVVRLLRAKVNFTSGLPRRGYLAVCPRCRTAIPADVGGML